MTWSFGEPTTAAIFLETLLRLEHLLQLQQEQVTFSRSAKVTILICLQPTTSIRQMSPFATQNTNDDFVSKARLFCFCER